MATENVSASTLSNFEIPAEKLRKGYLLNLIASNKNELSITISGTAETGVNILYMGFACAAEASILSANGNYSTVHAIYKNADTDIVLDKTDNNNLILKLKLSTYRSAILYISVYNPAVCTVTLNAT